jgi:hypothetical protein
VGGGGGGGGAWAMVLVVGTAEGFASGLGAALAVVTGAGVSFFSFCG